MSVAFTKEDSAETASETVLPDRPISAHPNLVTKTGLSALKRQLCEARVAYERAQHIEDVNERRWQSAIPLRNIRYLVERLQSTQLMPEPLADGVVAFGHTVTFKRRDGRVQTYRIVGEDEADPSRGSISFVSPIARLLLSGKVGDIVGSDGREIEILSVVCPAHQPVPL